MRVRIGLFQRPLGKPPVYIVWTCRCDEPCWEHGCLVVRLRERFVEKSKCEPDVRFVRDS